MTSTDGADGHGLVRQILVNATRAAVVVAATRVYRRRLESLADAERTGALAELIGTMLMFATSAREIGDLNPIPPIDVPLVARLATELASELAAARSTTIPTAAATELARELARALGVREPSGGWDLYEADDEGA